MIRNMLEKPIEIWINPKFVKSSKNFAEKLVVSKEFEKNLKNI